MSLAKWVEANVVDPLTEGRHSLLRETALELARQHPQQPPEGTVASQVAASLHLYPVTLVALTALLHIRLHKIDMASLIKAPDELFLSEEEWVGKSLKEQRKNRVLEEVDKERVDDGDAMEVEEPEQTWVGVDASLVKDRVNGRLSTYDQEGPEELSEVLDYVANVIVKLDQKIRSGELHGTAKPQSEDLSIFKSETEDAPNGQSETSPSPTQATTPVPTTATTPVEDPIIRNLRLNLLALAKRAPLDTIARLPKDLVPEHIRHFVPTLSSSG
jgi:bromodomain-containing protein 7/9